MSRRRTACLLACLVAGMATLAAQAPPPVDGRVRDLLVLVDGPDPRSAEDAANELVGLGPSVRSDVVAFLRTRTGCRAQWLASSVLAKLGLEPQLVEQKWLGIAGGDCQERRITDRLVQQDAANAVVDRVTGIELLTARLRGRDLLGRQFAAGALNQLTERLVPGNPRAIDATPEIVAATRDALPALRDTVQSTTPLGTRCAAFEALQRARDLPQEAIRSRAREVADRLRLDCEAITAPLTENERRESLEEVVSRLDRQPPDLAARTTSALLAVGAEAVPVLQRHLKKTERCRGLALAAGILAGQDAAAADVEAAFDRVARGRCDGDEPFDLQLAQSAAEALMVRGDGVRMVTTLLADRQVSVRRRAAQALRTLFDRIGSGTSTVTVPIDDPAILAAAKAALEPLMTAAASDRDTTVRCLAVGALERAQRSMHEEIRASAEAATSGRSLRCQTR